MTDSPSTPTEEANIFARDLAEATTALARVCGEAIPHLHALHSSPHLSTDQKKAIADIIFATNVRSDAAREYMEHVAMNALPLSSSSSI